MHEVIPELKSLQNHFARRRHGCRLELVGPPLLTDQKQINATRRDLETDKRNSANQPHGRSESCNLPKPLSDDNVGNEKDQYREN